MKSVANHAIDFDMTESEFLAQAEAILDRIERAIERMSDAFSDRGADVETRRTGPVLTIELESNDRSLTRLVVNMQAPMQQIWVAAKSGGFHFARADNGAWLDTRDGSELFAALSRQLSAQSGLAVVLAERD